VKVNLLYVRRKFIIQSIYCLKQRFYGNLRYVAHSIEFHLSYALLMVNGTRLSLFLP